MKDTVQQFEEETQHLNNIPPLLWSYYASLKEQGLTDEQAFRLTVYLQGKLFDREE